MNLPTTRAWPGFTLIGSPNIGEIGKRARCATIPSRRIPREQLADEGTHFETNVCTKRNHGRVRRGVREHSKEHFVQDEPDGVEVGTLGDALSSTLLRSHVERGTGLELSLIRAGSIGRATKAKVIQFDVSAGEFEEIRRLHVAVDDVGLVGFTEGAEDLLDSPKRSEGFVGTAPPLHLFHLVSKGAFSQLVHQAGNEIIQSLAQNLHMVLPIDKDPTLPFSFEALPAVSPPHRILANEVGAKRYLYGYEGSHEAALENLPLAALAELLIPKNFDGLHAFPYSLRCFRVP